MEFALLVLVKFSSQLPCADVCIPLFDLFFPWSVASQEALLFLYSLLESLLNLVHATLMSVLFFFFFFVICN